jgi:uncharacterized protein YhdP
VELSGGSDWPQLSDASAQLSWQGARWQALLSGGRSGSLRLAAATLDWDSLYRQPLRLHAHLDGEIADGLALLRAHPQLASWAPGLAAIELHGNTRLDLRLQLPLPVAANAPRLRLSARLDGVSLTAVPGLPPIEALRGVLTVAGGQLQRSTLSGRWLGGPLSLSVGERQALLAISGRGQLNAAEVLAAAHAPAQTPLSGSSEWSAQLTVPLDAAGEPVRWRLHADSNLSGIASALPEPLAKAPASAVPMHLSLQGEAQNAQLQLALGERLRAQARLTRSGDAWRIARGALLLGATTPLLPAAEVLTLDGHVAHLDLGACLGLWRQASADAALPDLEAHVSSDTLGVGARSFTAVTLNAFARRGAGSLELQSAQLAGTLRWPAHVSAAQPASVHLASFALAAPQEAWLAAALAGALAPASELRVDELTLQGQPLGTLTAQLGLANGEFTVRGLRLASASALSVASGGCVHGQCQASFMLDSHDAGETLAAFGLRREVSAAHARLQGELHWDGAAAAPLATLDGHLHMQLEDGSTALGDPASAPFALLAVPALLRGLNGTAAADAPLRFERLEADYVLSDGEARTAGLHFDGDAEILVRGRIGLSRRDYDAQAWVLKGEERLPETLRRLAATPRVAAAWLALRELFGAAASDPRYGALRLRGDWNRPIVGAAE